MATYVLRDIPPDLWKKVKVKAAQESTSMKDALLALLARWVKS